MKKAIMVSLVLIAALILASAIPVEVINLGYAHGPRGGHGMCSSAPTAGCGMSSTTTDIDAVKKFLKETLPLRDELITKRLELQNEYGKATPDKSRIATLRKEIIDIELKIQEKADAAGLSTWTGGMMGHGMMGRGMSGMGYPCPMGW